MIIPAFPGVGKTYFYALRRKQEKIYDSDSSKFDKKNFPQNYIEHIKSLDQTAYILVSSHKEVREALLKEGLDFIVVYPNIHNRNSYIKRYKERGSSDSFIELIYNNWDLWINEIKKDKRLKKIQLPFEYYLTDLFS